jgi:hypothetical protein
MKGTAKDEKDSMTDEREHGDQMERVWKDTT